MPLYLQVVLYIGKTILSLYILNVALTIFYKSNNVIPRVKKICLYATYILLGSLTNFLTIHIWINVLIHIILILIISVHFIGSLKSKVTFAFCYTTVVLLSEIIVSIAYVSILKLSLNIVILDDATRIVASIIQTLVLLIFIKLSKLYKTHTNMSDKIAVIDSLSVGVIPLCSIIILYLFANISLLHKINYITIIVACILLVFVNIFFFVLFDKLRLSEKLKYENAILKNQTEYYARLEDNAKNNFEKVRKVKHNLKYQLLYLKSKAEGDNENVMVDIKVALNKLIEDSLTDDLIEYTQNKSLNRLLNYKLFALREHNIPLSIKAVIREDAYIDELALYMIIGNAVDNAIRNFDSSQSKLKDINIRIIDDCNNLYVNISNPYNKKLKFKNGLPITDKSNSEIHGVGLKSIKELVESKNGYFKLSTENQIFTLEILLYDEIKHKDLGP